MNYYDIHTHHLPSDPDVTAIVNTLIGTDGQVSQPPSGSRPVYCSAGIHPWYIGDISRQFDTVKRLASLPHYVAIGEAGLDKRRGAPLGIQLTLFEAQARLAETCGKPLLIHCVKAWPELVAAKKRLAPSGSWIIHGFRGNGTLAAQLLEQGFRLSFGARFNPDAVRAAWPDRLFAETDEMSEINETDQPDEIRKSAIGTVYARLAAALQLNLSEVGAQLAANVALFGLPQ